MSEPIPVPVLKDKTKQQQSSLQQEEQLQINLSQTFEQQDSATKEKDSKKKEKSELEQANLSVQKNMPPEYSGEYKVPASELKDGEKKDSTSYTEHTEFGDASLSMHSSEFDTKSKPAGGKEEVEEEKKPKTAEEIAIDKTVSNLLGISTNYLKSKMDNWGRDGVMPFDINLTIRASYRLSSVTDLAAEQLIKWVNKNYPLNPDFAKYIKFNLIKTDPSPTEGGSPSLDMDTVREKSSIPAECMNHTLIYSAIAKDNLGSFQEVIGADKLIIAEKDSGVGMAEKSLNSVENGIHFLNKDGKYSPINSVEEAKGFLDKIKGMDAKRKERILSVVGKYIDEHTQRIDLSDFDKEKEEKPKDSGSGDEK